MIAEVTQIITEESKATLILIVVAAVSQTAAWESETTQTMTEVLRVGADT